jgi:hypothetical protein
LTFIELMPHSSKVNKAESATHDHQNDQQRHEPLLHGFQMELHQLSAHR